MRKNILLIGLALIFLLCGCSPVERTEPPAVITSPTSEIRIPIQPETENTIPSSTEATQTTPEVTENTETTVPLPASDDTLVRVLDFIPGLIVDLRYATANNFTNQQIYTFRDVYLRYGTVKKLMLVQEAVLAEGYSLKIWDGFRPLSAQYTLWDACPNPTYVADPRNGASSHCRGNTVDVTLVRTDGTEIPMPTDFDEFSALADRNYADCSPEAAANALFLEELMQENGFRGYYGEWWHYTDTNGYAVEENFIPTN